MPAPRRRVPEAPGEPDVETLFARRRRRLIEAGELPNRLPEPLSSSWGRSARLGLDPEHLLPRWQGDVRDDSRLARTADAVLPVVAEELSGEPVSLILADGDGHVLRRWCPDGDLRARLDRAQLDTGFSYREEWVGTNGIGTALESGVSTLVDGGAHWNDELVGFSCAAAPVRHPASGSVLGVVDLTALAHHCSPLLLAFTRSIAHRLEADLLSRVGHHELALLEDYLVAVRRTGGAVVAVGDAGTMLNRAMQERFDDTDRGALLARTRELATERRGRVVDVELPSGRVVRLDHRPSFAGDRLVGGVARVGRPSGGRGGARAAGSAAPARTVLPGLTGASVAWQDAVQRTLSAADDGAFLLIEGEDGTGKTALARATHAVRRPGAPFRVLPAPAPDGGPAWLELLDERLGGGGTVVLHRVDRWPGELVGEVGRRLAARHGADATRPAWVVATAGQRPHPNALEEVLGPLVERTVGVPPLRHRLDDVGRLVELLLERIAPHARVTVSAAAARQLALLPWPGNVTQLAGVLREAVRRRRSGEIRLEDLPAECLSGSRRQLTAIEAIERDAIVAALVASGGNKVRAATALGLSRATVYRKIREYGVTWPS